MTRDPRDAGTPGAKEWEEFRSGYAAAFLLAWLAGEARAKLDEYAQDLHDRFMSGWDIQEGLELDAELPEPERGFPLPPVGGVEREGFEDELIWMDDSEARQLYDQLFPHQDSVRGFSEIAIRMSLVALHAALEAYARGLGVDVRGPLPRACETHLQQAGASHLLDSATMRALIDCDATRNLIVHNRGVVDERYLRTVPYAAFEQGEFRTVSGAELRKFSAAIWKTAVGLRAADRSMGV